MWAAARLETVVFPPPTSTDQRGMVAFQWMYLDQLLGSVLYALVQGTGCEEVSSLCCPQHMGASPQVAGSPVSQGARDVGASERTKKDGQAQCMSWAQRAGS